MIASAIKRAVEGQHLGRDEMHRVFGDVMDGLPEGERARLVEGLHGVDLLAQHLTSLSAFARCAGFSRPAPG